MIPRRAAWNCPAPVRKRDEQGRLAGSIEGRERSAEHCSAFSFQGCKVCGGRVGGFFWKTCGAMLRAPFGDGGWAWVIAGRKRNGIRRRRWPWEAWPGRMPMFENNDGRSIVPRVASRDAKFAAAGLAVFFGRLAEQCSALRSVTAGGPGLSRGESATGSAAGVGLGRLGRDGCRCLKTMTGGALFRV